MSNAYPHATYRVRAIRAMADGRIEDVSSHETLGDAHRAEYRKHGRAVDVALALDATRDDFGVPVDVRYSVEVAS